MASDTTVTVHLVDLNRNITVRVEGDTLTVRGIARIADLVERLNSMDYDLDDFDGTVDRIVDETAPFVPEIVQADQAPGFWSLDPTSDAPGITEPTEVLDAGILTPGQARKAAAIARGQATEARRASNRKATA